MEEKKKKKRRKKPVAYSLLTLARAGRLPRVGSEEGSAALIKLRRQYSQSVILVKENMLNNNNGHGMDACCFHY